MSGLLLTSSVALLSAGGAALFSRAWPERFQAAVGRGPGIARILWAPYLAAGAWLVDNGRPAVWSGGVYLTWFPGWGQRPDDWSWSGPMPILAAALLLSLWFGFLSGWWTSLEGRLAEDVPRHSLRGLLAATPAAMVVAVTGIASPWPLVIVGALCGPIYWACKRLWHWQAGPAGDIAFGGAVSAALLFSVALT